MRYLIVALTLFATSAFAGPEPREGWEVHETPIAYKDLISRVKAAVKVEGLFVVTQAGPTGAAKKRGITIPGNRVIGVYNNVYAVRMIRASVAAMIEAPIRFYVTEDEDGATLSYKTPSYLFSPYADDSPEVMKIATELDEKFASIARRAVAE
ncbi:MAG: DUF302 domain-containing protein [Pikeienuella sp.]